MDVADAMFGMIDWDTSALTIDNEVMSAKQVLMAEYGEEVLLDSAIVFDREYGDWVSRHVWSHALVVAPPDCCDRPEFV